MSKDGKLPSASIHNNWKQRKSTDATVRLGTGDYVDIAQDMHSGEHRYGYVATWKARRLFLEAALRVQPSVMSELLADNVLDMVLGPAPAQFLSGPTLQIRHETLLVGGATFQYREAPARPCCSCVQRTGPFGGGVCLERPASLAGHKMATRAATHQEGLPIWRPFSFILWDLFGVGGRIRTGNISVEKNNEAMIPPGNHSRLSVSQALVI